MAGAGEYIVAISVAGSRLVYSKSVADFDLWRMELGPDGKAGPETLFLHSTRSERFPVFAPDGREIAFISDRWRGRTVSGKHRWAGAAATDESGAGGAAFVGHGQFGNPVSCQPG